MVKGFSVNGWIHHSSWLLAYKTMCWPGRTPVARPSIVSNLSGPPRSALGTLSNTRVGVDATELRPQLPTKTQMPIQSTSSDALVHLEAARMHSHMETFLCDVNPCAARRISPTAPPSGS